MYKGFILIFVSVMYTSHCLAQDGASSKMANQKQLSHSLTYTCFVGDETRVIQINRGKNHCNVQHDRNGKKKEIASAKKSIAFCERIFNTVRFNIEKYGHNCLEGNQAQLQNQKKRKSSAKYALRRVV